MDYITIPGTANEPFILFHGTGGNEYSLLSITGELNPKAPIISFLGNEGSGTTRRFFKPLDNGQLDREDFDEKVNQFLSFWDNMDEKTDGATLIGYSNGANFILGLLEKRPDLAQTIVLLHPSNLHYSFDKKSGSSLFLSAGSKDTLSPPGTVMQLSKQLEKYFSSVQFELFDGGHGVSEAEVRAVKDFLKKRTGS